MEILIRLYINYKEMKEKEIFNFQELNDDNKYSIYLINENWIKKYKLFFEYEKLENHLNEYLKNINIQNNYILSDEKIQDIISNLPFEYINTIMIKSKDEINKKIEKLSIGNYKCPDKKEYKFFCNFEIINNKIYGKLFAYGYEFQDYINKVDCYYLGNKKILLFFAKENIVIYNDIIGFINNDNIFIPEYLIIYNGRDIIPKYLNNFFSKAFISNDTENNWEICLNDNKTIGHCYKINDNKEQKVIKKEATEETNDKNIEKSSQEANLVKDTSLINNSNNNTNKEDKETKNKPEVISDNNASTINNDNKVSYDMRPRGCCRYYP